MKETFTLLKQTGWRGVIGLLGDMLLVTMLGILDTGDVICD